MTKMQQLLDIDLKLLIVTVLYVIMDRIRAHDCSRDVTHVTEAYRIDANDAYTLQQMAAIIDALENLAILSSGNTKKCYLLTTVSKTTNALNSSYTSVGLQLQFADLGPADKHRDSDDGAAGGTSSAEYNETETKCSSTLQLLSPPPESTKQMTHHDVTDDDDDTNGAGVVVPAANNSRSTTTVAHTDTDKQKQSEGEKCVAHYSSSNGLYANAIQLVSCQLQ